MKSIVINGFGRIGRNVLKSLYIHDMLGTKVDVVALNLHDPEQYAYLFKHDSTYGTGYRTLLLCRGCVMRIR